MNFPIVVKLAPRFVEELSACEWGSYEDCRNDELQRTAGSPHVVDILKRRKSGIEIRSAAEATEVYYALASGTFQLAYEDGQGFKGALAEAKRLCDQLRPLVSDLHVLRWRPDGH